MYLKFCTKKNLHSCHLLRKIADFVERPINLAKIVANKRNKSLQKRQVCFYWTRAHSYHKILFSWIFNVYNFSNIQNKIHRVDIDRHAMFIVDSLANIGALDDLLVLSRRVNSQIYINNLA